MPFFLACLTCLLAHDIANFCKCSTKLLIRLTGCCTHRVRTCSCTSPRSSTTAHITHSTTLTHKRRKYSTTVSTLCIHLARTTWDCCYSATWRAGGCWWTGACCWTGGCSWTPGCSWRGAAREWGYSRILTRIQ